MSIYIQGVFEEKIIELEMISEEIIKYSNFREFLEDINFDYTNNTKPLH